jgi:Zn-dependent oligopeptidase
MTLYTTANPLLQIQFQIPFDQIRAENVEPAIDELLRDAREELDRLTSPSRRREPSPTPAERWINLPNAWTTRCRSCATWRR